MKTKKRIKKLERRVKVLEKGVATTGYIRPAQGVQNPSYTIESSGNLLADDREIKSIKATSTLNPVYGIDLATGRDFSAETIMINPLESVKQQVTQLLKEADLPDKAVWVSVDWDGVIWYQKLKPKAVRHEWVLISEGDRIGKVNLNGADWVRCCWKISDLLITN